MTETKPISSPGAFQIPAQGWEPLVLWSQNQGYTCKGSSLPHYLDKFLPAYKINVPKQTEEIEKDKGGPQSIQGVNPIFLQTSSTLPIGQLNPSFCWSKIELRFFPL